jgi:hypothetical protein
MLPALGASLGFFALIYQERFLKAYRQARGRKRGSSKDENYS